MSRSRKHDAAACPRAWEVEAIADGRLVGASAESLERHLASCAECARERAAIEALARAAETLPEPAQPSELDRRRSRAALLRRANDQLVARAPRRTRWVVAGTVAAAATVALVGTGVLRARGSAALAPPEFEIASVHDAAYRAESAGADARPVLTDGVAQIHVSPLKRGQRFVLSVPDGEIEVHGTRFVVEVVHAHTSRVEVTEGIVALRLRGSDERFLRAGERWSMPAPTTAALAADPPAPTAPAQAPAPPASADPPLAQAPAAAPRAPSPRPAASGPQGAQFAAAMKAFSAGDYADADARLGAFAAAYPGDPRSEDAAFLRAVARARLGDKAGAASLAKAYLAAYPNGLRRQEALLMAAGK